MKTFTIKQKSLVMLLLECCANPSGTVFVARANRVYPGKVSGLIVDYAGVFRNLHSTCQAKS